MFYIKLLAKKLKTISYVNENGKIISATVIVVYPHLITDIKENSLNDVRINLAAKFILNKRKLTKSIINFFEKRNLLPLEKILSSRINKKILDQLVDQKIFDKLYNLNKFVHLENLDYKIVDITSKTKGLGFTGTVKRHNFKQGPKTHGSKSYRRPGSIGAGTNPGRVIKNKKMAGRSGFENKTINNINILTKKGYVLTISNSIPGKNNTDCILTIKFK